MPAPYGNCMGFTMLTKHRCTHQAKFTFKVYSTEYSEFPIVNAPSGSILHLCGAHAKENGLIRKMGAAVQQIFPADFLVTLDPALANPAERLRTAEMCIRFLQKIGLSVTELSRKLSRDEMILKLAIWRRQVLASWPSWLLQLVQIDWPVHASCIGGGGACSCAPNQWILGHFISLFIGIVPFFP